MNTTRTSSRLLMLAVALIVIVGVAVLLTPSSAQMGSGAGTTKHSPEKDLADLQRLTGENKVAVYLNYNPTVLTGRIKGMPTILGRNYLQLQNDATETLLINVDTIAAIKQTFN